LALKEGEILRDGHELMMAERAMRAMRDDDGDGEA